MCQLVGAENGEIELRLSEVNGVSVTLSSVDITVRKVNRHAGFISYYIMKVPKGSKAKYSKAIRPVRICGESRRIRLKLKRSERQVAEITSLGLNLRLRLFSEDMMRSGGL